MPYKDPEEKKEYNKKYSQTPSGLKSHRISKWKQRGVKCDDFDKLYELYLNTNNCDVCKKEFENTYDRCLDHNHTTGEFRQILCRRCNTNDYWETLVN